MHDERKGNDLGSAHPSVSQPSLSLVQLSSLSPSSSSSSLLSHAAIDAGAPSPSAAVPQSPVSTEPTTDPIHDARPIHYLSCSALCGPPSLAERIYASSAATEARALRPLFKDALRSSTASMSAFVLSSYHIARDFALATPHRLSTAAGSFYRKPSSLRLELLLGVSLSALLVVDAIAFAITAGVLPIVGMYACFLLTLFTSVLGGCPGMVSGAAGSTAAVQASVVSASGAFSHLNADERLQLLFLTLLLAGVLEVLVGWLGLASLAILIPAPVMVGFMQGLAGIILQSQLAAFQYCPSSPTFTDCSTDERRWLPFDELTTWLTAIHLLLAVALMEFVHRLPVPHIAQVPAVLIAVFLGCCLEHGVFRAALNEPTRTVKETAAINGELPTFAFPTAPAGLSSSDVGQVLLYAVLVAFVGLVESILTLQALNVRKQRLSTSVDYNAESVAQGVGNVVCSLFGALGGCALVGESSLNVSAGSRSRLSTFVSAWCIAVFIAGLYDVVNLLPIATVAGCLFSIVLHMIQWRTTLSGALRLRPSDALTVYAVTAVSIVVNLSIGVLLGIVLQALVFAWDMQTEPNFTITLTWEPLHHALVDPPASSLGEALGAGDADGQHVINGRPGTMVDPGASPAVPRMFVHVRGVLYFGSVAALLSHCHPDALMAAAASAEASDGSSSPPSLSAHSATPVHVVLDMQLCRVLDYSGSCAVDDVLKEWRARGWTAELRNVDDAQKLMLSRMQPITPSRQPLPWDDAPAEQR